jgi:L-Ala-D/L-Glu epimerase
VERIWSRLGEVANNQTAKGALDLALHDIAAQAVGVPLWRYLGGWRDELPVTWMIHLKPPQEVAAEVAARAAEGFSMFKLKAGVDPDADLEMVRLVRRELGDSVRLYLDANQGYTLPVALRVARELASLGVEFLEEPLPVGQLAARQQFAQAGLLPVLGDDSCFSPADVARELSGGTVQLISVKPPRTGAFLSRKIAALAEAAGAPCLIGTQGELMAGTLASAHVGAAFAQFRYPGEFSLFKLAADDLLAEPLSLAGGMLKLPSRPGIGALLDPEKLQHYRVDR